MFKIFRKNTLLCFSPPIMIATIVIELGLAAWVFTRYSLGTTRRIAIAILVCLAGFQLAEFSVCGATAPDLVWSRIGYVFITMLPPMGIHLITRLRGEVRTGLIATSYTAAGLFIAAFTFLPAALNHGVCTGNYVIFQLEQPFANLYGFYYLGLVFLGLMLALWKLPNSTPRQRQALRWLAIGYVAFTVPTLAISLLVPIIHGGIPSVMCGFAVIFATILGAKVVPLIEEESTSPAKSKSLATH